MDDLSEKLAGILNDPESMNQVRQMAQGLLSKQDAASRDAQSLPSGLFADNDTIDPAQLTKVMSIINQLKNGKADSRAALLLALKPHLSEPRQEKIDTAVKLLKLIDILPALKQSGFLNF